MLASCDTFSFDFITIPEIRNVFPWNPILVPSVYFVTVLKLSGLPTHVLK